MNSSKELTFEDIIPILKSVTVFSGFQDCNIRSLCERCEIITAAQGELIIEENTPATEIYIILRGRVSIQLGIKDAPFELQQFGPGNCLGEASVIGIQKHSASAVAVEKTSLLVLSRVVLMEIFDSDKMVFSMLILNIARELARRLHHSDELILKYRKEKTNP
jgi:CRP-like cAMP-binding protein